MRHALVAGWVTFAWLAVGASSAPFWLDSGQLSAASWDLGVVHPPGIPGLTLLSRLMALVPVGSLGFRMALGSAALAGLAVGLVVAILQRRAVAIPILYGAALWIAVGLTFVRQGRVLEVYALAVALAMATLWGLDPRVPGSRRTSRRLIGVAAAVWATWSFGDLRLCLPPLCIVVWAFELRAGRAWTRWAPAVVAWASLVVLAVPLASASAPTFDWGDPDTGPALWDHLMARSIRTAYADEILPPSAALWLLEARAALGRLAQDLGAPGLVAFALALVRGAWTQPRRPWLAIVWLCIVQLVYIVGVNPMGGADRQTGLLLGPLCALVVATELHALLQARPRGRLVVLPLAATVLVVPAALHGVADTPTTRSWGPHAWTRGALADLPPGAVLLTQSDDLAAGVAAARALEGARPDVVSLPAQHLYKAPSEAALQRSREAVIWSAVADRTSEAARIVAAIEAAPGPVALEHPAAGIFAEVPWWSPAGRLPLRRAAVVDEPAPPPIPDQVEAWLHRLPTVEDRRRLGIALADLARAEARRRGDLDRATAVLRLSLSQVYPDHPAGLVTLGALRHAVGDREEAIALTRLALRLEPGRSAALTNLALYLSEDPAARTEALTLAERAARLRPWRADVWERLALVRARAGDADGAAEARNEALRARARGKHPSPPEAGQR